MGSIKDHTACSVETGLVYLQHNHIGSYLVPSGLTPFDTKCISELCPYNPLHHKPVILRVCSFENTVGKGEIALDEQFLFFSTVFSTRLEKFMSFSSNLKV